VTPSAVAPQVRERTLAKGRTLIEALPFLQEHRGTVLVIKVGGAVMTQAPLSRSFADDIALIQHAGIHPVLVHGGGPQVTEVSERLGLSAVFVDGLRVTDAQTLDVATMVLAGTINTDLVALLGANGVRAAGLSGVDAGLALARPLRDPDLGFVGEIVNIRADLLQTLIDAGVVPVIASIAADGDGQRYNVNADVMAAEVAVGVGARKLVYVNDVPGVIGPGGDLLSELSAQEALDLLATEGVVDGGMIPKLESSVRALKGGVDRVHLLDGRVEHALVLELFTPEGIGTMLAPERPDAAREDASSDGGGDA